MSDPQHETSTSASFLLESLLGDDDGRYGSSSAAMQYLNGLDTRPWTDCWDVGVEPDGFDVSELQQLSVLKKKRKRQLPEEEEEEEEVEAWAREEQQVARRQRGRNWEKAEEELLLECKSGVHMHMHWRGVSECLQEHGFVRTHKHCADKWYALRKHYLEVHQWIEDHPGLDYWDRSNCSSSSERIRSVPPSFCQRWYQVFDSVEHRQGRKLTKLPVALNQHQYLENGRVIMDSHKDLMLDQARVPLLCNAKQAMVDRVEPGCLNVMEELVKEIQNLSQALTWRIVAEQKERSRNLAIQEKKLELKRQRFDYQLRRDRFTF